MTGRENQYGVLRQRPLARRASKLTLTAGLRYEYYPLMTRADRGIERLDFSTFNVLLGGVGNVPEDLGIKVSKNAVRAASRGGLPRSTRRRCSAPATASPTTRCRGRGRCAASTR